MWHTWHCMSPTFKSLLILILKHSELKKKYCTQYWLYSFVTLSQNDRKYKQWWSTFQPISIKRTITSHITSLNKNTDHDIIGNLSPGMGQSQECGDVKPVYGVPTMKYTFLILNLSCVGKLIFRLKGNKYSLGFEDLVNSYFIMHYIITVFFTQTDDKEGGVPGCQTGPIFCIKIMLDIKKN